VPPWLEVRARLQGLGELVTKPPLTPPRSANRGPATSPSQGELHALAGVADCASGLTRLSSVLWAVAVPESSPPPLGDAKSSLGDAESSLGDAKSSLGDAESSLGDAKSSLGDAESSLGDAKSSLGDAESSLGDAKSSLGDAESSLGDAESSLGDAKSLLGDAKSSLGDAESSPRGDQHAARASAVERLVRLARTSAGIRRHLVRCPGSVGVLQRCKTLRIVTLGFGTGRQRLVLERWTNPKPQRRKCKPPVRGTIVSREIGGRRVTAA
jgi:hypothetical protein